MPTKGLARRHLHRAGLLNKSTPHLSELMGEPKRPRAFCTSGTCSGRLYLSKRGVEKFVEDSVDRCPDCGMFLIWGIRE